MKSLGFTTAVGTALLLLASVADAGHSNAHASPRHKHHRDVHRSRAETGDEGSELRSLEIEKRGGQCQFPSDAGLVAVTPGSSNAGWAMSPDQPCQPGHYCPYACPSGQMMAQWDPDATSYTYPQSMNGGLFCDKNGNIQKPFPDKPYCVSGTGSVGCKNKASGNVAFCQTVLPGNEAMLIPTNIEDAAELTVPGPDYWCGTAAHFYINPPGVSTEEACVWGSTSNPYGNWSPYVAGANTDKSGNTFVKLAWNPIYLEPATPFRDKMPTWGVEIVCEGGGCNGLPCAIDPSKHTVNEMTGTNTDGAGGANFCVVTVPKGSKANFVVFDGGLSGAGSSSGGSSSSSAKASSSSPSPPPSSSPTTPPSSSAAPTSSSSSSPSPKPSSSSSSSSSPSSAASISSSSSSPSSSSSSSSVSSSSFSSSSVSSSDSASPSSSSSTGESSSSSPAESSSSSSSESSSTSYNDTTSYPATTTVDLTSSDDTSPTNPPSSSKFAYSPHILVENSTATASFVSASVSAKSSQSLAPSTAASSTSTNSKSAAPAIDGSALYSGLSFIVALLALGL